MKLDATALIIAISVASPAAAQAVRTIYTGPDAVLCASPFSIKEAKTAAASHDEKWVRELNCVQTPAGMAAIVIEVNRPLAFFKVRVQPLAGGDAMTVFGSLYDFTEPAVPLKAKSK